MKLLKKIINIYNFFITKLRKSLKSLDLLSDRNKNKYLIAWRKAQGDKTLRLEYSLDKESLVLDAGGYEGQWASDIFSKYCCTIYIFEPVIEFANKIEKRFSKNEKIKVFKFGTSDRTEQARITIDNDGSSVFKKGRKLENAKFVRSVDFMKENDINRIDLLKINIEGGEYSLLEDLINSEFIKKINNIQVQFHDFIPNAYERYKKIYYNLKKTHFLTYQYYFVWENWQIKEDML